MSNHPTLLHSTIRHVVMVALSMLPMVSQSVWAADPSSIPELVIAAQPPGNATCTQGEGGVITLANDRISLSYGSKNGRWSLLSILDPVKGVAYAQRKELFDVRIDKDFIQASAFQMVGSPVIAALNSDSKAVRAAARLGGWQVSANFTHAASGMNISWRAELRHGSHYVRQILTIEGSKGTLTRVMPFAAEIGEAKLAGAVGGTPVCSSHLFFGLELPTGNNSGASKDGSVYSILSCDLPLKAGQKYEFPVVIGSYPEGQLRRAFLRYIERERAAPCRQFLHYNGFYDYVFDVSEQRIIDAIETFNREFIVKRGVSMDAFVIDDGWDDWKKGFWTIDTKKFPNRFQTISEALGRVGSGFGIWISPLAGYAQAPHRIAWAEKAGLIRENKEAKDDKQSKEQKLDLSYAPYHTWFLDFCSNLIKDDRVLYFKFDRSSGSGPHFLNLLHICDELRKVAPKLFINITVGTWPSPFWLNHIDCTWRNSGLDMGYEGPGDEREQWITYRDARTWEGVVSKAPLYPLNSIMTGGICLSDGHELPQKALNAGANMRHEARTYFGSGTALQELYVKPSVTTSEAWDQLAEAAKWSKANADVLVDTHWVGGNPSKGLEVYGWASWSPRKGLLTLRNPSDAEKPFGLEIGKVFELPISAATTYKVTSAYADTTSPISTVEAGKPITLTLKPFEVLVLEMMPVN